MMAVASYGGCGSEEVATYNILSAIKSFLLLLALLCAFHPSPLCEAAVCYVKPTEPHNVTCPSEPCYTLDEYVSNSTRYFVSNTVFMFLTGYHHLSHDLTVSDAHNITLNPYVENSTVIIASNLRPSCSLMFELASNTVITNMTLKSLSIRFVNSTNVTLAGLTAEGNYADSIIFVNVFGSVDISQFKCVLKCLSVCSCIVFEWPVLLINTQVLLHELELTAETENASNGVSFLGCITGEIVLRNSLIGFMDTAVNASLGPLCNDLLFMCENTRFHSNGLGLHYRTPLGIQQNTVSIILHNVSYMDNILAINLYNVHNALISNCNFERSHNGAITVFMSNLLFKGNITFIDNHVYESGGAISLLGECRILIPDSLNTYILFENNTADDVGGAIYFSSCDAYEIGFCKIFVEQIFAKTVFNFSMNTAANGGNAIYGAYLDAFPCFSPNGTLVQNLSQLLLGATSFSPSLAEKPSVISSNALRLCFCDDNGELGNCNGIFPSVYPGQVFEVSVAALGDMKGFVEWPVYATVSFSKLESELQHIQFTNAEGCTNFQYSILSKETSHTLSVTFSLDFRATADIDGVLYSVYLLKCPLGFSLGSNEKCECHKRLQTIRNITCNITELTIQRQGTTWIGVLEDSNTSLVFSTVCPFLYCNTSDVKVPVNDSFFRDEYIQCTGDRSGVLCGGCRENLSLALGSNRCLHGCGDNSLFLIIAFAAAGIALVFFIKTLNLTVSQGTINGLVFYANIVGVERTVLFSSKPSDRFLSVFIAWVNLDLGIETCFFDGMDAYTKAWLQFVFPVYVWAIALFIIILSHFSICASKVFGNNSVPVLATLILLSYSKLLRAVISALSVTDIQFLNGSTMSVWERDGNLQYLTGKHIPLFVFAVAVLILICFPLTLILFSIQWLQKRTHYRLLHWISKLIPFFDAFTGPLKDKHRHWVGALLLARCTLLLIIYIYTANGSGVAYVSIIFVVTVILVFLAVTSSVYKNYYLSVLEISYICNLGILATGTLYVQYINGGGNQEALAITSVGIAFLQFMATVIYHVYVQMREPLRKLKVKVTNRGGHEDVVNVNQPDIDDYESLDEPVERPPFQEFCNLREPLLASLND